MTRGSLLEDNDKRLRDYLVLEHGLYAAQRAVRTEDWKLIRTFHDGAWELPETQLYNVATDPREQDNIAPSNQQEVNRLEAFMQEWKRTHQPVHGGDNLPSIEPSGWRFWKDWN